MSIPALMPADVTTLPSSIQRTLVSTLSSGNCRWRSSASSQCVVTRSVRITPLAASRKAPVHTDAVTPAVRARVLIHSRDFGSCNGPSMTPPGMSSTSSAAWLVVSILASGRIFSPARVATGPGEAATVCTEHQASEWGCIFWYTRLAVVNTSYGPAKSRASMPSKASRVKRKVFMRTRPVPRYISWQNALRARWRYAS